MFKLIKEIGRTVFMIIYFPILVIDMRIHAKKWDEFFEDDSLFRP